MINLKEDYKKYVAKRDSISTLKRSELNLKTGEVLSVFNFTDKNIEENWVDGVMFALYVLYNHSLTPNEWNALIEDDKNSKFFGDVKRFDFMRKTALHGWQDYKFRSDVFAFLSFFAEDPDKFVLESLPHIETSYITYTDLFVKEVSKHISEEALSSVKIFLKVNNKYDE